MPEKIINADGNEYHFIPGKNGSLTTTMPRRMPPLMNPEPQHVSKVIPILKDMRKKSAAPIPVGSTRG